MSCKRTARRPPRKLRAVVDSLAFGGDAVARADDGRVLFIPGGAPGDELELEIEEEHKAWVRTRIARILRPGPTRVEPTCPLFLAGCGGCQWQHVDIAAQRAAKEDIVRRALRKVAAEIAPLVTPSPPLGWRRRARLRVRRGVVGYTKHRSHELIETTACPQLEPALDAALQKFRSTISPDAGGDLELLIGKDGAVSVGSERIDLGDGDRPFWAQADVFAQASAPGNDTLRALVREAAGNPKRVLELFAGSGNFTRDLLATGAEVVAIEEASQTAALALDNLPPERLTYLTRSAEPPFPDGPFDLVVVDPPRTGLSPALAEALADLRVRIIYVSCDPQTLGRDLGILAAGRTVRATPVDLMPQTFHVEIVAVLA